MADSPVTPPPAQSVPSTGGGPVGKPRAIGVTILVTIVTLGVWTWFWSYWNGNELQSYRRDGVGGVGYFLITFFIAPVTMFMMAGEVEKLYRGEGKEPPITTIWGLWFLLPLIGNIIWYVRIQSAINEFWQARGATESPALT